MQQLAQQHRVGDREGDPVDAQHGGRHRRGRAAAARPEQHEAEEHRQRRDGDQQDLELAAVLRGQHQRDHGDEAGELDRVRAVEQLVELGQAHDSDRCSTEREDQPALGDDEDREDDRRDRRQDAPAQIRAAVAPSTPPRPAGARRWAPAAPRPRHQRPPNRRRRASNSASDSAKASRVKSGHSSSRNTSSE